MPNCAPPEGLPLFGTAESSFCDFRSQLLDRTWKGIYLKFRGSGTMSDILIENAVRVIDLFKERDENGAGTVSKKEFRRAMPLLGLEVPRAEVDALFDSWDPDGSGSLEIPELNKVLRRGAEVPLDKMPHPAP